MPVVYNGLCFKLYLKADFVTPLERICLTAWLLTLNPLTLYDLLGKYNLMYFSPFAVIFTYLILYSYIDKKEKIEIQ